MKLQTKIPAVIWSRMLSFLSLFLLCHFSAGNPCSGQEIQWYPDLPSATKAATEQNKLLLMHFTAQWCRPCKTLDSFVFKSPAVKRSFHNNVIAVKIDVDQNTHLVQEYGVSSVPYDVAVTPSGRVVAKRKSPKDAVGYDRMLTGFGKITNSLISGKSPALAQNLAEFKEMMQNPNPVFEGQPTSFTPDAPTYQAPQPSRHSADLHRKMQVVGNPYAQQAPPQQMMQNPNPEFEGQPASFTPDAPTYQAPQPSRQSADLNRKMQVVGNPYAQQAPPQQIANAFQPAQEFNAPDDSNDFGAKPTPAPKQPAAKKQQPKIVQNFNMDQPNSAPAVQTQSADIAPPSTPGPNFISNNEFDPNSDNDFAANAQTVPSRNTALQRLEQSDVAARLIREKAQRKLDAFNVEPKHVMEDKFFGAPATTQISGDSQDGNYQAKISLPQSQDFLPPEPPKFAGSAQAKIVIGQPQPNRTKALNASNSTMIVNQNDDSRSTIDAGLNQASVTPAKPKYALHGKCPVTLLTQSKWVDGDPNWGCVHRNRIYIFTSGANLKKFQSDPDAHSPILAGYDPVIFHENGKLVDGVEKHGVFMGDTPYQRIVLFANAKTRARFQLEPRKYLEAVRQAMKSSGGASSQLMR